MASVVDAERNNSMSKHIKSQGQHGSHQNETEKRWTSWIILVFVVVDIILFLVTMFVNNCPSNINGYSSYGYNLFPPRRCAARFLHRFSFQPLRENPLYGPSSSTLLKLGALESFRVVHQHQAWRLFASIWLHAGLIHLIVNLICLVLIGIRLEQQFGFVKIGIIYIVSGFGGGVLSLLFSRGGISVGASGALFGFLGAMLSELLTNWTIYTNKAAAFLTLLVVIVVNLGVGIVPRVDNFAHIGGFITGFLLGFVLLLRPQYTWMLRNASTSGAKPKYNACQIIFFTLAVLLFAAGFAISLAMLFRGKNGNDHCSWCHYLNCVPTSKWSCDV